MKRYCVGNIDETLSGTFDMFPWTTEPPTKPGWYWTMLNKPRLVKVSQEAFTSELHVTHTGNEQEYPLSDYTHWLGPLLEPENPEHA